MTKRPLNISEEAAVQMPMKTVASFDNHRSSRHYGLLSNGRKFKPTLNKIRVDGKRFRQRIQTLE